MKVRMKVQITGTRNGEKWPPVGGVIDLPTEEAEGYIAQGYCEPVKAEKAVATPRGEKRGVS